MSINEMNYDELKEYEEAIKLTKEADAIYNSFMKFVKLDAKNYDFSRNKFKVWSDSHNQEYITTTGDRFTFQCRFLHEAYDMDITKQSLFGYLKRNYKGIPHLKSYINKMKGEEL